MKRKIFIFILITLLIIPVYSIGQVAYNQTFKRNKLQLFTIKGGDSLHYKQIQLEDLQQTDEIGKPCLPVKFINLIIPTGKDVSIIALSSFKKESILLDKKIIPAQAPIPISLDYEDPGFIKPDSLVYNSDNPYPKQIVKVVHQGYFDGNKRIVTIAVCPFQYYPKQDSLIFYSSVNFTLNFKNSKDKGIAVKFRTKNNTLMYNKILRSIVNNPQDISKCIDKSIEPIIKTQYSYPYFEYIIITNNDLAPAFNEFIGWKRRKGINAGVVTLDYIYKHYNGDIISSIYDSAGQIRQFLHDAYINGTKYVLMAGDNTVVPIRYGWGEGDDDNNEIPTDLYFSSLNDNWDVDHDYRYGELEDNIDYEPELFVGRLLCSNTEEIANWTKKLLKYELNPGNGDYAYLTKAFFTQADEMQGFNQAGNISTHLTTFNSDSIEIWEEEPSAFSSTTPDFPTGAQVINEMNKHYGLISLIGHGGPTNVAVATPEYNECLDIGKRKITAFDNKPAWCEVSENGNGFDNLTNTDYPSIFYSISCDNMPFDDFHHEASVKNLAESYTMYSKGGGPAYLGNTRSGIINVSWVLFARFADLISDETEPDNIHLGIAEAKSKIDFTNFGSPCHYVKLSHNLIGCPETEIWTAIPSLFTNVSIRETINFNPHPIRTTAGNYSVTVNTGVSGCNICVMSVLDNGMSYYKVAHNVSNYSFSNVVKPYYVTITKHNYISYLKNPENIYIQNKTITDNLNISAKNIYVGSNVTTSEPAGPVIIKNGVKVIFDAEQEVNLEQGFEIELGGEFEIKK